MDFAFGLTLKAFAIMSIFRCGSSFFRQHRLESSNTKAKQGTLVRLPMVASFTLHGGDFKFLPCMQPEKDEFYPRIIHIAGMYPGVNIYQFAAPMSPPAPEFGMWSYDFPDPNGPHLGTVAVPGSPVIAGCIDPVAVVTTGDALGMKIGDREVLVVVDRAERDFSVSNFYAFGNQFSGEVVIASTEELEDGWEVLGRVVLCLLRFHESDRPSTGFLEDD